MSAHRAVPNFTCANLHLLAQCLKNFIFFSHDLPYSIFFFSFQEDKDEELEGSLGNLDLEPPPDFHEKEERQARLSAGRASLSHKARLSHGA